MTRMHEQPSMSDQQAVMDLELAALHATLNTAGAGRRVVPSQPEAGAEAPAPRIVEQQAAEVVAEQAATASRRGASKNTFLVDESGNSGVIVPKDADAQIKWVKSKHNPGNLDSKQIAKLTPKAQEAYAAHLKDGGAAAARNRIDTVLTGKQDGPTVTDVLSGTAKPKNDEKPAKATTKPAEAANPAPEVPVEKPYEKMDAADQVKLSEAAEAAVRNGNNLKFTALADQLGLPVRQRREMIAAATEHVRSNAAAAAQQAQPKPTTTPVTNTGKPGAEQVGSPADDKTGRFSVPEGKTSTQPPKPRHYTTTPLSAEAAPELTPDEKMQRLVYAAAAEIYQSKKTNGVPGKDQLTSRLTAMAAQAGLELPITAMRGARNAVHDRVRTLERFDAAADAAAEALAMQSPNDIFDKVALQAEQHGNRLGLSDDEIADIVNARAIALKAAAGATTPPAQPTAEAQPQPEPEQPTAQEATSPTSKGEKNLEDYRQALADTARSTLDSHGYGEDAASNAAQAEEHRKRVYELAAELNLSRDQVEAALDREVTRQAAQRNHEQMQAAPEALRESQTAEGGKSEFVTTEMMDALADRAQLAHGVKNQAEATWFKGEFYNAVKAAGGTDEDFDRVWAQSAERFDERRSHLIALADEVMEARVAGDNVAAHDKAEEFLRTGELYGFYTNEEGKEDALMLSIWATAQQQRVLEGKPLQAQQTPESTQSQQPEFKPTPAQSKKLEDLARARIIAEGKGRTTGDWTEYENLIPVTKQLLAETGATMDDLRGIQHEAARAIDNYILKLADYSLSLRANGHDEKAQNIAYAEFRAQAEAYGYTAEEINGAYTRARDSRINNGQPVEPPEPKKGPENQRRTLNDMTREEWDKLFRLADEAMAAYTTHGGNSSEYFARQDALLAAYKELGFDAAEVNPILWASVRKAREDAGAPIDPPEAARNVEEGRMTPERLEELRHLLEDKRGAGFKTLSFAEKRKILDEIDNAEIALALAQEAGEVLRREDIDAIRSLRGYAKRILTKMERRQLKFVINQEQNARREGETRREWRARLERERAEEETAPVINEPAATKAEKDPIDLWLAYEEAAKQATNASWLTPRVKAKARREAYKAYQAYVDAPNPEGHRPIEPEFAFTQDHLNDVYGAASQLLASPDVAPETKQNMYQLLELLRRQKNIGPKELILLGQPRPERDGRDRNAPILTGVGTALQDYISEAYDQINAAEHERSRSRV